MYLLSEHILGLLGRCVNIVSCVARPFGCDCEDASSGMAGLAPAAPFVRGNPAFPWALALPFSCSLGGGGARERTGLCAACQPVLSDNLRPCWHFGSGMGASVQITDWVPWVTSPNRTWANSSTVGRWSQSSGFGGPAHFRGIVLVLKRFCSRLYYVLIWETGRALPFKTILRCRVPPVPGNRSVPASPVGKSSVFLTSKSV